MSLHVHCATARDTAQLGARLAQTRPADDALRVVYLRGDLGAGKTTFASGFLEGLGVPGPVRSPTFTLLETYTAVDLTVLHVDLYRLQSAEEIENLGLRDFARPHCLWLIEWPERGEGYLPAPDLELTLTSGAQSHEVTLLPGTQLPHVMASGTERAAQEWLDRLADIQPNG